VTESSGLDAEEFEKMQQAERASGQSADPSMDAFLKAQTIEGGKESIVTDYMLKVLGLDVRDPPPHPPPPAFVFPVKP